MIPIRMLCLLLLLMTLLASSDPVAAADQACLRCHGMKSMAYQDPVTGGLRNLAIDPAAMAASSHAKLTCRACHGAGFESFPHFSETKKESLSCLECHKGKDGFPYVLFESIEKGFMRSVHAQALPDRFTCFSCHNPHAFHGLSQTRVRDMPEQVRQDNGICLNCHSNQEQIRVLTGRAFPGLLNMHAWLPDLQRHWRTVRCVECHTSSTRPQDHFILDKRFALRDCVACHSRNSVLLKKLYLYRSSEERQKAGFIHSLVMNNAYIIGMTRNLWLDWAGGLLLGLTLLGLLGHGMARWLVARKGGFHEQNHS
ncbi:MAG: nitrate reductase [Magnetococcales bacterium]|nr:nitrate reductase [Magnetococcales bacterium]